MNTKKTVIYSWIGLFMIELLPVFLFYFIILDFTISGVLMRLLFIFGTVFIISYGLYLERNMRTWAAFTQLIIIQILLLLPLAVAYLCMIYWYYNVVTHLFNRIYVATLVDDVYPFLYFKILFLIIAAGIGALLWKKLNFAIGISVAYILGFISLFIPVTIFYFAETPLFQEISLDPAVEFVFKTDVVAEDEDQLVTSTVMRDVRDLIALPEQNNYYCCYATDFNPNMDNIIEQFTISNNTLSKQGYDADGSSKRMQINSAKTKIYVGDYTNGGILVFNTQPFGLANHYEFMDNHYYIIYKDAEEGCYPEFHKYNPETTQLTDDMHPIQAKDVMNFVIHEDSNELAVCYDSYPILQKYRLYPHLNEIKFMDDYCLVEATKDLDSFIQQIFYHPQRDSYFFIGADSSIRIGEIDRQTMELKQGIPGIGGGTIQFVYYPNHQSILVFYITLENAYEYRLDDLQFMDTHILPRGIRNAYIDNEKDLLYALDYFQGRIYIYDLENKSMLHSYYIGQKPIGLDVHPQRAEIYFSSSFGLMKLDLQKLGLY